MSADDIIILTDPDRDRYASPRLIRWWDQARLRAARVMVVGAGALGNEALKNLALLGAGQVWVVDFDKIEVSNLSRSVLFRESDAGRSKAEVAAARAMALNPDVRVRALHADVVRDVGLGVFRRMQVVLGCLDNREARWAVNRACWRLGIPWVDGGLDELNGAVKVFIPPEGACYECGLTEQDWQFMAERHSCTSRRPEDFVEGKTPTTITSAAIIAGVQTQEALKLLHGRPLTPGSAWLYDGLKGGGARVTLNRRADCLAHDAWAPIVEVPASVGALTARGLLQAAQAELGLEARIYLDREFVTRMTCSRCGRSEPGLRPYRQGQALPVTCPECGGSRYPDLTFIVQPEMDGLDQPLAALGLPPLHILEARNARQALYLELTGDAAELFGTQSGGQRD